MADLSIVVDSSISENPRQSHDIRVRLNNPIKLGGRPHELALTSLHTWFSWFNIDEAYNNTKFVYSVDDGSSWKTIDIPRGNYNYEQLFEFIHFSIAENGDVDDDDNPKVSLAANLSTSKIFLTLAENCKVDFSVGEINVLFGFEAAVIDASQYGSKMADITNSVNIWHLHCDIIMGSGFVNEKFSDVIYSFVPDTPPLANIKYIPSKPIYLAVNRLDSITGIHVYLMDQKGRPIDLNGENLTAIFHLRPRKTLQT